MDPSSIELLAASFARVCANKEDAATVFYARLFMTAPYLRPMFKGDLEAQKQKLIASLAQIVDFYRVGVDPTSYLKRLGRSHKSYGAERSHFEPLGDALVFTLAQILGEDFTPQIRAAWVTAYEEVSSVMQRGMEAEAGFAHGAAGFH